jgi:hypothetical protein
MRIVAAVIAALVLATSLPDHLGAQTAPKKGHKQARVQRPAAAANTNDRNGYVEHHADKLPFGSSAWWEQMLREDRAGTCCR